MPNNKPYTEEELEKRERAYFESVLRSRAKTDPDVTIKEWHDRHFEVGQYKPHYSAAHTQPKQQQLADRLQANITHLKKSLDNKYLKSEVRQNLEEALYWLEFSLEEEE